MNWRAWSAVAVAVGTVDGVVHAARLLALRQGWTLSELAPTLAVEVGLATLVAALVVLPIAAASQRALAGIAAAVIAGGLVFLSPGSPASECPETVPGPPSDGATTVVLLTGDTLRRDHVSAYPDALILGLTPNLEALAAQGGLRFDDAVTTAPLTLPSHTTLLSGMPPDRHGVVRNGRIVPGDLDGAPQALAAAGYATGAFVSSSVLHGSHGLGCWFEAYRDELGSLPGARRLPLASRVVDRSGIRLIKERGDRTVDRALDWLERRPADTPVFLWVHLYDAHTPHDQGEPVDSPVSEIDPCDWHDHPSRLRVGTRRLLMPDPRRCGEPLRRRTRELASAYAGAVSYMDAQVGRLVDGLKANGRWDGAALLFVADHGESIAEQNQIGSHEYSLYEPVARVPMILKLPTGEAIATTVPDQVSTVRVAATLATLGGVEPTATMVGPDLLTSMVGAPAVLVGPSPLGRLGGNSPGRRASGLQIAVRTPELKVLRDGGGYVERYDLTSDPGERTPLLLEAEVQASTEALQESRPLRPDTPVQPGVPGPLHRRSRPVPMADPVGDVDVFAAGDRLAAEVLRTWASGEARERSGLAPEGETPDAELPPDVLEALRALGYVD